MRTLIFAQADDAVRLAISLRAGILIGGMDVKKANKMVKRFARSKHGVIVATMAYCTGWSVDVEAHVFFLDCFPGTSRDMWNGIHRVKQPPGVMTADDLLECMALAGTLNNTLAKTLPTQLALKAGET